MDEGPRVIARSAAYLFVWTLAVIGPTPTHASTSAVSPERQAELVHLVRQECGSCHGLTLKGGLGPALLPESLEQKPADILKIIILNGSSKTPMPPWRGLLAEEEIDWIIEQLKGGFPSET